MCVAAKYVHYVENNSIRSDWRTELMSHGGVNESIYPERTEIDLYWNHHR